MKWETKILHLGLGRFHRGHQAVYYQRMAELGDASWGVSSFSMRSPGARDEMQAMNCRYPVVEWKNAESQERIIESIRYVGDATEDRAMLEKCFVSPATEIVTLTVTEKGYALNSEGKLDFGQADIVHDLSHPDNPKSAIGILAWGLRCRQEASGAAITVISCDNLRDNGGKLSAAVKSFQEKLGRTNEVAWSAKNVAFPCSMVDRIVPAAFPNTPEGEITTERFSQWVIADDFTGVRPSWHKVGVEFVKDVRPYEEMKLRLLNAAHSLLAYGGILAGHSYVHQAVNDEKLRARVEKLFSQVIPLIKVPSEFDVTRYTASLLERFNNPKLPHSLQQIAMDGSQKLPQRLTPSLDEAKNVTKDWMAYVWLAVSEQKWELKDPLAAQIQALDRSSKTNWEKKLQELSGIHLR